MKFLTEFHFVVLIVCFVFLSSKAFLETNCLKCRLEFFSTTSATRGQLFDCFQEKDVFETFFWRTDAAGTHFLSTYFENGLEELHLLKKSCYFLPREILPFFRAYSDIYSMYF